MADPTSQWPVTAPEGVLGVPPEGLPVARGPSRLMLRRLVHDRAALIGFGLLAALGLAALFAPLLAPYSPTAPHYADSLEGPGTRYLLGTDNLGRDELSRLLYGARLSLGAVLLATTAIMVVGVAVGLISGYYRGPVDSVIQRVLEILLAFPSLVLALAIVGILGPGLTSVLIAVVAVGWVSYARLVRAMVLSVREQPYVEGARAVGARGPRIMLRAVLPNIIPPVIVLASLEVGALLLTISALSFLGLGAQPPTPEWGTMLNQARPFFQSNPHLMIAPGLAIALTVLAFNLIGDGLRDALDPKKTPLHGSARSGLPRPWRRRRAP